MMDRRAFVTGLGAVLATPFAAEAQQAGKVARIGYLLTGSLESPETRVLLDALRLGLHERGYVEGQNIVIEYRAADGNIERLPGLATDLARLKLDLIVAGSTSAVRAVQQATKTIPIVSYAMGEPVGDGLVASLARPGGACGSCPPGNDVTPPDDMEPAWNHAAQVLVVYASAPASSDQQSVAPGSDPGWSDRHSSCARHVGPAWSVRK
jgi:ABC-type uncharacterized transport system substrate-binding protein